MQKESHLKIQILDKKEKSFVDNSYISLFEINMKKWELILMIPIYDYNLDNAKQGKRLIPL